MIRDDESPSADTSDRRPCPARSWRGGPGTDAQRSQAGPRELRTSSGWSQARP